MAVVRVSVVVSTVADVVCIPAVVCIMVVVSGRLLVVGCFEVTTNIRKGLSW